MPVDGDSVVTAVHEIGAPLPPLPSAVLLEHPPHATTAATNEPMKPRTAASFDVRIVTV
jgi:hypothetical protein